MLSCVTFENFTIELGSTADDEHCARNIEASLKRGLPTLKIDRSEKPPLCIVGGGPSIKDEIEGIRGRQRGGYHIWALNGAHDWLVKHDILPDAAWLFDARPDNAAFYANPIPETTYYICGRCDPAVFEALAMSNVVVWWDMADSDRVPKGSGTMIGGVGTNVGSKAMTGAYTLGYRRLHLFGYDCSYRADEHHAYPQSLNDGAQTATFNVFGREFVSSFNMMFWVKNYGALAPWLAKMGCEITVHGDGLLPWVHQNMQRQMSEQMAALAEQAA